MRLLKLDFEDQTTSSVITMPKAKPTQVIVHRVELQEKERDMLEVAVGAKVAKELGQTTAIIAGVGAASWLAYKSLKPNGWAEDFVDEVKKTPAYAIGVAASQTQQGRLFTTGLRLTNWLFKPVNSS